MPNLFLQKYKMSCYKNREQLNFMSVVSVLLAVGIVFSYKNECNTIAGMSVIRKPLATVPLFAYFCRDKTFYATDCYNQFAGIEKHLQPRAFDECLVGAAAGNQEPVRLR